MSTHDTQTAERFRPFGTTIFAEMTALAIEHGAVNLSQGFPDFDGPEFVRAAAVAGIESGANQYAPMPGIAPLREAVAGWWKRASGLDADPGAEITVTNGCTGGLAAALLGLCDPGDEVVMFEPAYDAYRPDCAMAGAVPRFVTLRPGPDGFAFNPDELAAAFNERTRAVLINTPHNPTGKVFTRNELTLIAGLCEEHDAIAIADEVYERLVFAEGCEHVPIASIPGMADRTLTLSSLGKTFSLTGWKIGWAIGSPELTRGLRAAHQFLIYAVPPALQMGAAVALRDGEAYVAELHGRYAAARGFLCEVLDEVGFEVHEPEGTYFVMCSHGRAGEVLGVDDDVELCRKLTCEVGVAAIPPSAFYNDPRDGRHLVRFAFCKKPETLEEAARRLRGIGS
jgi:aspartate/methionine/tyrosine aminotransferase